MATISLVRKAVVKTASLLFFMGAYLALGIAGSSPAALAAQAQQSRTGQTSEAPSQSGPKKVLLIMSYHTPWEWTADLTKGFKEGLAGLDIEYRSFEMDTKRNSSEQWKQDAGTAARNIIDTWKPDLVYTTDDNAQEYVTKYYVNGNIPFVFSAVNAPPEQYGFVGSSNITGTLEHEHFIETVSLLRKIAPKVKKIAVIVDDDPTWTGVMKRMKDQAASELRDFDFVSWDLVKNFEEYKDKIRRYQTSVDALGLLGIHTFKDHQGSNVPWQQVIRWTVENSNLPDFTFWKDRIPFGTLCAVYVSGYEQGLAAGRIAREILEKGKSPSSFPMHPTRKGEPIVSLARAKRLGINLTSDILLSAKIVQTFQWQAQQEK